MRSLSSCNFDALKFFLCDISILYFDALKMEKLHNLESHCSSALLHINPPYIPYYYVSKLIFKT